MTLHVAIVGPIATDDVRPLLEGDVASLPVGYAGAPLLVTLISELLRRGHRVTAVTTTQGLPLDWRQPVTAHGRNLTMVYVPSRNRAWRPNGWRPGRMIDLFAFERRGLQHVIQRVAPDVVHAHWTYEFAWAALQTGLPHLITCHDSPLTIMRLTRSPYRLLRAGMAWHVLRNARRLTAVSPYIQSEVRNLCRVPLTVVPNPVPDSAFEIHRVAKSGRQRIAMICNGWGARKNPEPALRAFATLAKHRTAVELDLVGVDFEPRGIGQRWWEAQCFRGHVRFCGPIPHDRVMSLLAESDVLLHSALEESFGMVIAEAMAVGLPVVAGAKSGAVPWVVGEAGRLVDVTQPDAISAALEALLAQPESAQTLGELGRRRVREKFGAAAVAAAYEREYLLALAEQSR